MAWTLGHQLSHSRLIARFYGRQRSPSLPSLDGLCVRLCLGLDAGGSSPLSAGIDKSPVEINDRSSLSPHQ
jgi:hypothetical protein